MTMKTRLGTGTFPIAPVVGTVAISLAIGVHAWADEPARTGDGSDAVPLGSPAFHPSPDRPVGWRGDGSGRYPGATPPLHWGRAAKSVKSLRSQATKPKPGETGKPIPDGTIREWLILGPVPIPEELKQLDKELLPDEANMAPSEGEKVGELAWKRITSESQTIVFRDLFGVEKATQMVAYACAYVHSESAQKLSMQVMWSGGRLLLNGEPVVFGRYNPTVGVNLQQGWNRVLFRMPCVKKGGYGAGPEPHWYVRIVFYGAEASEREDQNIAWSTRLPGSAISTPIIVGDRIFVTVGAKSLCCLDKSDGRLIWMRTITLADVATEEEKKANPAVFGEIASLAAKLKEVDLSVKPGAALPSDVLTKGGLEGAIAKLMKTMDPQKYRPYPTGECADAAPTPTSNGRHVYVTFHPYLNACFDLDGNAKWVSMHAWNPPYNGRESHGIYCSSLLLDGKLIVRSDSTFALDTATGKTLWQGPSSAGFKDDFNYASLLALTIKTEPLVVMPPLNVYRVRDGKQIATTIIVDKDREIPMVTPVIAGGRMFTFGKGVETISLPASPAEPFETDTKRVAVNLTRFPQWGGGSPASPLYHEGLVYRLDGDGILSVVDTEKQELVYQQLLDLDLAMDHIGNASRGGACSSPALAGKYIYLFGNLGTCVVIEPGRTFRPVARNRIDVGGSCYGEIFASCPVFERRRLYYRASANLYCIEEDL